MAEFLCNKHTVQSGAGFPFSYYCFQVNFNLIIDKLSALGLSREAKVAKLSQSTTTLGSRFELSALGLSSRFEPSSQNVSTAMRNFIDVVFARD